MSRVIYTAELLQEAVNNVESVSGVLRYLGLKQTGGTHTHVTKKLKEYSIDTSHFSGRSWSKGKTLPYLRKTAKEILVVLPEGSPRPKHKQLKRALLEVGLDYRCECGNIGEWNGKLLCLEIDHRNGDWLDNRIENLRFLCPNCHSQEATTNRPHKNARVGELE